MSLYFFGLLLYSGQLEFHFGFPLAINLKHSDAGMSETNTS